MRGAGLECNVDRRAGSFFQGDFAQGLNLGMGKAGGMVITF
jgi:hypothetical protein